MDKTHNKTHTQLRLSCATCQGQFRVSLPSKHGSYALECPHCKARIKLKFAPPASERKDPKNVFVSPRVVEPVLGQPDRVRDKLYVIKQRAVVYRPYRAVCPDCGSDITLLPKTAGKVLAAKCNDCSTMILYKAVDPAAIERQ